ncbi:MAG: hypothetical protein L6V93_23075 [Clostridiales bacterium]|nr:MAG: hypothetical protein L6V93_23075 [Clostridiales bacterium]
MTAKRLDTADLQNLKKSRKKLIDIACAEILGAESLRYMGDGDRIIEKNRGKYGRRCIYGGRVF